MFPSIRKKVAALFRYSTGEVPDAGITGCHSQSSEMSGSSDDSMDVCRLLDELGEASEDDVVQAGQAHRAGAEVHGVKEGSGADMAEHKAGGKGYPNFTELSHLQFRASNYTQLPGELFNPDHFERLRGIAEWKLNYRPPLPEDSLPSSEEAVMFLGSTLEDGPPVWTQDKDCAPLPDSSKDLISPTPRSSSEPTAVNIDKPSRLPPNQQPMQEGHADCVELLSSEESPPNLNSRGSGAAERERGGSEMAEAEVGNSSNNALTVGAGRRKTHQSGASLLASKEPSSTVAPGGKDPVTVVTLADSSQGDDVVLIESIEAEDQQRRPPRIPDTEAEKSSGLSTSPRKPGGKSSLHADKRRALQTEVSASELIVNAEEAEILDNLSSWNVVARRESVSGQQTATALASVEKVCEEPVSEDGSDTEPEGTCTILKDSGAPAVRASGRSAEEEVIVIDEDTPVSEECLEEESPRLLSDSAAWLSKRVMAPYRRKNVNQPSPKTPKKGRFATAAVSDPEESQPLSSEETGSRERLERPLASRSGESPGRVQDQSPRVAAASGKSQRERPTRMPGGNSGECSGTETGLPSSNRRPGVEQPLISTFLTRSSNVHCAADDDVTATGGGRVFSRSDPSSRRPDPSSPLRLEERSFSSSLLRSEERSSVQRHAETTRPGRDSSRLPVMQTDLCYTAADILGCFNSTCTNAPAESRSSACDGRRTQPGQDDIQFSAEEVLLYARQSRVSSNVSTSRPRGSNDQDRQRSRRGTGASSRLHDDPAGACAEMDDMVAQDSEGSIQFTSKDILSCLQQLEMLPSSSLPAAREKRGGTSGSRRNPTYTAEEILSCQRRLGTLAEDPSWSTAGHRGRGEERNISDMNQDARNPRRLLQGRWAESRLQQLPHYHARGSRGEPRSDHLALRFPQELRCQVQEVFDNCLL